MICNTRGKIVILSSKLKFNEKLKRNSLKWVNKVLGNLNCEKQCKMIKKCCLDHFNEILVRMTDFLSKRTRNEEIKVSTRPYRRNKPEGTDGIEFRVKMKKLSPMTRFGIIGRFGVKRQIQANGAQN